jgi:hypothetical protein
MECGRNCNMKWEGEMIQLGKAAKGLILASAANLSCSTNIEIQPGRFTTLLDDGIPPRATTPTCSYLYTSLLTSDLPKLIMLMMTFDKRFYTDFSFDPPQQ